MLSAGPGPMRRWPLVGFELDDGRRFMVGDHFRHTDWDADVGSVALHAILPGGRGAIGGRDNAVALADTLDAGARPPRPQGWRGWLRMSTRSPGATSDGAPQRRAIAAAEDFVACMHEDAIGAAERAGAVLGRAARLRAIDRLLAEDARACPAFATARRRAVVGAMERPACAEDAAHATGWTVMAACVAEAALGGKAFSKAHLRLTQEMGAEDTACNSRSHAIMLEAVGRPEPGTLRLSPSDAPWVERAKKILGEKRRGEPENVARLASDILAELHRYEAHRGGARRPRRDETRCLPAAVAEAVEVYERSRGLV